MLTMKQKSKKTTASGIGAIITAVLAAAVAIWDGDPATVVDWKALIAAVGAAITGWGLLKARDHDVSSKRAGVDF